MPLAAEKQEQVVVVLDDDPIGRHLLQCLVESATTARTVMFAKPTEALEWCRENTPDVVITDFEMAEMNGIAVLNALRSQVSTRNIPIMMVTEREDNTVRYAALECGANDYITKPLDAPEVRARVRNMLALREGQKLLATRSAILAREVRAATQSIEEREKEIVFRLARAAEYRDSDTGSHLSRIALMSQLLARGCGMSESEQYQMMLASPMHDVGKIGMPDHILLRTRRLTEDEFALMKEHTIIGHRILAGSSSPLLQLAAEIALTHHERFDGSGYPNHLAGEQIPLAGRIVSIVDVFDALLSTRPYKAAWTEEEALGTIASGSGTKFDPFCVRAFLAVKDEIRVVRASHGDDDGSDSAPCPLPMLELA